MDPASARQLDIFADSREVVLRNALLEALEREDAAACRTALGRLVAEFPDDPARAGFEALARDLEARTDAPFADRDALARARRELADHLVPAARGAMDAPGVADWTRRAQRRLAARAEGLAFSPAHPDDHAAAFWAAAGDWAEVERAVGRIESWRRIPAPLAWALEARWRRGAASDDDAWPLLAELAWMAPARLDALLRRLDDDAPLQRRLKRFGGEFEGDDSDDSDDGDDLEWLPAWLAITEPSLAPRLASAQPGRDTAPERGMRCVVELLGLERQGRHAELMQRRKSLRDLHGPLYRLYMATR